MDLKRDLRGFVGVTRPSDGKCNGSCIDNIFMKTSSLETKTFKLINSITDHYPIFVTVNKIKTISNQPKTLINYHRLRNNAQTRDWNAIKSIQDPNLATDYFINEINICTDLAKTKIKGKKKPRKMWITQGILNSCYTKEHLYKLWKLEPKNEVLK